MDKYAVIGNPIGHSRSPAIHRAFAEQTGVELEYGAILAPLDGFKDEVVRFRAEGGHGLNVTVPFKLEAYTLCERTTERAQLAGAVNTLRFDLDTAEGLIEGDNTDGVGLVRDLDHLQVPIKGQRILILGAGGAVRGVLAPLLAEHPEQLTIANRSTDRAEQLVRDFTPHARDCRLTACAYGRLGTAPEWAGFNLIINATPTGLSGEMPPVDLRALGHRATAYDMAYGAEPTVFMRWAEEQGAAAAYDGLGMLVEQAAESFFYWQGIRPDTVPVRHMLRHAIENGE